MCQVAVLAHKPLARHLTFYIGQTNFPHGDSIEIISVERNKNQMTVKGHYSLVSADEASLWLNITATNNDEVPNQTEPPQSIHISKGSGDFELSRSHLVPGLPHVSMYDNHHSFAGIYFGTKAEAAEEGKLNLHSDYLFGPVMEWTLVDSKNAFESEAERTNAMMMIDFDTGTLWSGSQAMWQADTDAQKRWMQTNGVDALCVVPKVGGLVCLDMKTLSVPPQSWDGIPANMLDQLEHGARQDIELTASINSEWQSPLQHGFFKPAKAVWAFYKLPALPTTRAA
jgi:hypothetical protein